MKESLSIKSWLEFMVGILPSDTNLSVRARMQLLSHVLQKPISFLYTHPDYKLSQSEQRHLHQLLQRCLQGEPLAYVIGTQGFWSFELMVTPAVLIPRPETELLVTQVLQQLPADKRCYIADLGTGSGAIAIALAKERPLWRMTAVDISADALNIASRNAQQLNVTSIEFKQGSWCQPLETNKYDCIVSNPPYIAQEDPALELEVKDFEPNRALIAGKTGLECFEEIARSAKDYLVSGGCLAFEHGYQQAEAVRALLQEQGYQHIKTHHDYAGHPRVTHARLDFRVSAFG